MISYSAKTKNALFEIEDKKRCCHRIFEDMIDLKNYSYWEMRVSKIESSIAHFKCASCFNAFLRGIFIIYGNVTDPNKRYHLELSFESPDEFAVIQRILLENGIKMSCGERKGRYLLYIKSSEKIEDFFASIGANKSVFDLMNSKIVKELNGQANRQMNCDMANIKKTISSAQPFIDAIDELKRNGKFSKLSNDLQVTADLRVTYPQASITELGAMHNPPISKSGVKHRLDKIISVSKDIDTNS